MRLDDRLIKEGVFASRDDALRAVIAGEVLIDEVPATSTAQKIKDDSVVRLRGRKDYVSRGGKKLKGAIDAFNIDVSGLRCIDIGSSTGGFSDCLLQEGAAHVVCVDVNYSQLSWKVRTDPRVVVFERTNIKDASPSALGAPFDAIVIDVSFISLASLASTLAGLADHGTKLIALIKPQFESKRGETVGGVVKDESVRERTIGEVRDALSENGFDTHGVVQSPIKGPAGNIEYLLYAIFTEETNEHS